MQIMRSSKGAGARVSPARTGSVSLSAETGERSDARDLLVDFEDGPQAVVPLNF